ncbi:hypothetical protein SNEBB_000743, partial [Seison nebaliae]
MDDRQKRLLLNQEKRLEKLRRLHEISNNPDFKASDETITVSHKIATEPITIPVELPSLNILSKTTSENTHPIGLDNTISEKSTSEPTEMEMLCRNFLPMDILSQFTNMKAPDQQKPQEKLELPKIITIFFGILLYLLHFTNSIQNWSLTYSLVIPFALYYSTLNIYYQSYKIIIGLPPILEVFMQNHSQSYLYLTFTFIYKT